MALFFACVGSSGQTCLTKWTRPSTLLKRQVRGRRNRSIMLFHTKTTRIFFRVLTLHMESFSLIDTSVSSFKFPPTRNYRAFPFPRHLRAPPNGIPGVRLFQKKTLSDFFRRSTFLKTGGSQESDRGAHGPAPEELEVPCATSLELALHETLPELGPVPRMVPLSWLSLEVRTRFGLSEPRH